MNHFTRLIDLTSADEAYISALAANIAPCILRPKTETSLTMEEKHAYRLIRDLFAHKDAIFNELKRMSTPGYSGSLGRSAPRPRAISTDESNRKANMEERNRLLLEKAGAAPGSSRSRATSPAPGPRGHRRDRSTGGPETRFPIASPTVPNERHRSSLGSGVGGFKRQSLEVPGSESTGSPVEAAAASNGSESISYASRSDAALSESPIEKRNSLSRSGARFSTGRRIPVALPESPRQRSETLTHRAVTLEDKPMVD